MTAPQSAAAPVASPCNNRMFPRSSKASTLPGEIAGYNLESEEPKALVLGALALDLVPRALWGSGGRGGGQARS